MRLVIDEKAIGKERPRVNRCTGAVYTPKKTKEYEDMIKQQYILARGELYEGAINVSISCYFKKTKKELKDINCIYSEYIKKPDADNIAKAILDGLNGVAFTDDSQVANLKVSKRYGMQDQIIINIEKM